MSKYYAGIGSRSTPTNILKQMSEIAANLSKKGYTLRSGHADGADIIFETSADQAEVWLPWWKFNYEEHSPQREHHYVVLRSDDVEAFASVSTFHPNPNGLSQGVVKLMARNYRQVVGFGTNPNSEFVVCWIKGGKDSGGTGQALRIAAHFDIPIYNLFFEKCYDDLISVEE